MSATKIGFEPDGDYLGSATGKVSLYGKTPIVQQTAPAAASTTQPAASGSTFLASVQSLAMGAVTLSNAIRQDLIDIGVYA